MPLGLVYIADGSHERGEALAHALRLAGLSAAVVASESALSEAIEGQLPDAILMDQGLPARGGLAACRSLKQGLLASGVPLVLLVRQPEDVAKAMEAGCQEAVLSSGSTHLLAARVAAIVAGRRLLQGLLPLERTVEALVQASASQDSSITSRAHRRASLMVGLAKALGIPQEQRPRWWAAGSLYHVGALAFSSADEEHISQGETICRALGLPWLLEAIRHHHQWWDGGGQPEGRQGDSIPLLARALAVVDAYDEAGGEPAPLGPQAREAVIRILRAQAGKALDPALVAALAHAVRGV